MADWHSRFGLWLMRGMARLPLAWVRGLGRGLGWLLYWVAVPRRRVALTNLRLCFPEQTDAQRRALVRQHFVLFAQAWLDRSWLWEGSGEVARARLQLVGELEQLQQGRPVLLFAPHFVGMDAGWTALTAGLPVRFCGLYATQSNPVIDAWMAAGRQRFGQPHVVAKRQGLRALVSALRAGEPLYLLPDMDHGTNDSIFAPFFGVPAATLTSLSRLARVAGAVVVPVLSRLTPTGYEVRVLPAWEAYPSGDVVADTEAMNRQLETYIGDMPAQYYWVHKRFKTRPPGEASVYQRA